MLKAKNSNFHSKFYKNTEKSVKLIYKLIKKIVETLNFKHHRRSTIS